MTEEELIELVDAGFDAIIVRDSDGLVAYWNKGAQKLYGWSESEALGQVTHNLLRTEFPIPLADIIKHVEQKGHWTGELRHTCKDGHKIYVLSRWSRRSRRSKLPDILEVNTDISARKATETKLHEMNQILLGNEREMLRLRAMIAEKGLADA